MSFAVLTLILKKIVTLFALVDPFAAMPLFIQASQGLDLHEQRRYARLLGITVAVSLLTAGLAGEFIMEVLGTTAGGMRVGGGILILILAVAMVLGQEKAVKRTDAEASAAVDREGRGIVPLGIPMLAGPAAFSFMMTHDPINDVMVVMTIAIPGLAAGLFVWIVFHYAAASQRHFRAATLNVIERIAGFFLAGIAVDMIAAGLRELFPILAGAR